MYSAVATNDPAAVELEVQSIYRAMFLGGDPQVIARAFGWTMDCFAGNYADFQAVDTRYHDLEHTLQGTLCMVRMLHGRHKTGEHPLLTERLFKLGLIAILFHDVGYLKKRNDSEGTGAKFTITHVDRSAEFAAHLLGEKGFGREDIKAVQNMIHCTGVDAMLGKIQFQDELERIVGHALGTADLLGQMAASDYVEKLPVLYAEFAEAARHNPDKRHFVSLFSSAQELMRKTPDFWEGYVHPKLDRDFERLHRFLNDPYPDGSNEYLDRIKSNIRKLKQQLASSAA
jgi:hypothetical protein